MHRERDQPVLGQEARLAGDVALAEERGVVAGREGEALGERQGEAAELAAGGLDEGELAVEAEIAERLAGDRGLPEDRGRGRRRVVAGLEEDEREIDAEGNALGEPHVEGEVPGDLVLDDVEGDVIGLVPERDRPVNVMRPQAHVPVERPRGRRRLEVEPRRGIGRRVEAAEVEGGDRLGGFGEARAEAGGGEDGDESAGAHRGGGG